jgi:Protein of unknown function (DUF1571)
MSFPLLGRFAILLIVGLTGCGIVGPRRDATAKNPPPTDRSKGALTELALAGSTRQPPLADPSTMIPPPPRMDLLPEIPSAPPKDDQFVSTAAEAPENALVMASAHERVAASESNIEALRRVYNRVVEKFGKMEGFESRLTRRETVNGRAMPEEVLQYKFRKEPYSVYIKWLGLEGQGRELIYVAGKYDGKVQILTGKDEGLLIRSGQRHQFLPTDSTIRSKSRYDIREGGMATAIGWFGRSLAAMESDPSRVGQMRYLGVRPRRERESGLEAIEEVIQPNREPLMSKGGKRTTYFDPDPSSPSFGLPVLMIAVADNGREVEYYWFDQLKPVSLSDADFDADRLWRK